MDTQIINIPFAQGVDTKSDPKQLPPGKLTLLENGTFVSPTSITARNGFTTVSAAATIPDQLFTDGSGSKLYGLKTGTPSVFGLVAGTLAQNSGNVDSGAGVRGAFYTPVAPAHVQRSVIGATPPVALPVAGYIGGVTHPSDGLGPYLQVSAYPDTTTSVLVTVADGYTGEVYSTGIITGVPFTNLMLWTYNVGLTGAAVIVFCNGTTNAKGLVVSTGSLGSWTPTSASVFSFGAPIMSARVTNSQTAVVASFNGVNVTYSEVNPFSGAVLHTQTTVSAVAVEKVAIGPGYGSPYGLVYEYNVAGVETIIYVGLLLDLTTAYTGAPQPLTTAASGAGVTGSIYVSGQYIYTDCIAADTFPVQINGMRLVTVAYGTGALSFTHVRSPGVYLAGGPVTTAYGRELIPCYYAGPTQGCYLLLDAINTYLPAGGYSTPGIGIESPSPIAQIALGYGPTTAAVTTAHPFFSNVAGTLVAPTPMPFPDGTGLSWAAFEISNTEIDSGVTVRSLVPVLYTIWLRSSTNAAIPSSGKLVFTGGKASGAGSVIFGMGVGMQFDGQGFNENNFLFYPEPPKFTPASVGAVYTYQYVQVWEYTDGTGVVQRSAPSVPVTVTTLLPIDNAGGHGVTVAASTIPITGHAPYGAIYRTTNNGTVFYKVGQLITDGAWSGRYLKYTDVTTDALLLGSTLLYTTGGVVENAPLPPSHGLTNHRSRIFAIDSTHPENIWYSRVLSQGAPVEFSASFIFGTPQAGGGCTALASMDDKLVIFKADRIFYLSGQGPDATGGNNDFIEAIPIVTDVGCINPRSVVVTPFGVMFQSRKGICLLDRALQISYKGSPVEAYLTGAITPLISSAVCLPKVSQVRFTIPGSTILVYDYFVDQWSVFTNLAVIDASVADGVYYISTGSSLQVESTSEILDTGNLFGNLRVILGAVAMGGLPGVQRIRRAIVEGTWGPLTRLDCSYTYGFGPAGSKGTVSLYGPLTAARVHLPLQKASAVALSLSFTWTTGESALPRLSSLGLEVGVKKGGAKIPAAFSTG
jgi:hypothetical protein